MTDVLLVPDLPIEHWPSMDRYASRLSDGLAEFAGAVNVSLAGRIGQSTSDEAPARAAGATPWGRYWRRYVTYPKRVAHLPAQIVHVLDHSYAHVLHRVKRPSVVTVHDLMPVRTRHRGAANLRTRTRDHVLGWVLRGLRRASAFIVGTAWMRDELAEWLGDDRRIHVVPFGVEPAFFFPPPESREAARDRLGIPQDAFVVLHVGSAAPRKNLRGVVAAFAGLRASGVDAWLVQTGAHFTPDVENDVASQRLDGFTKVLGPVDEAELHTAYHLADVLLFPSLYEGFGFPVLEAMASKLPVIHSGAGGMAEVSGDAGVVVPGREVAPYVDVLVKMAGDAEWRAQVADRGHSRAAEFSWGATASRTAQVYEALG